MIPYGKKIFGIGLNKTGTTTLGTCLSQLGYRHGSCRRDLLVKYREGSMDDIFAETDRLDSAEDWPYPLVYRDLFFRYGEQAKFILTRRATPQIWLRSLRRHALRSDPDHHCRRLAYGYDYPHGYEEHHINYYNTHNFAVQEFFSAQGAQHQLLTLCWEEGHGWGELCQFLGLAPPDRPLPKMNGAATAPRSPLNVAENIRRIRLERMARQSGSAPLCFGGPGEVTGGGKDPASAA